MATKQRVNQTPKRHRPTKREFDAIRTENELLREDNQKAHAEAERLERLARLDARSRLQGIREVFGHALAQDVPIVQLSKDTMSFLIGLAGRALEGHP